MRKILIIALVLIMIPAALFAKNFSFGIGATASTGATISGVIENELDVIKPENFVYGAYANVKLLIFSANATLFPVFEENMTYFAGDLSAGLALDIAVLRVQAGISVNYVGSTNFSDSVEFAFETEDIKDAPLNVRAEVDVLLGNLNVGVWGILPTTATLNTLDKILEVEDRWQDASIGVCIGVCF